MATTFRDFSRGVGGRRGAATLGGLSTSTAETEAHDIQIDAAGIFDFFRERDQDKADRKFLKKNAKIFGVTPDEIDDFSRSDLRKLKSDILKESAKVNIDALTQGRREDLVGEDTGDFISLLNQGNIEGNPLEALLGEDTLSNLPSPERTRPLLDETDVLGLGGEEAQPRFSLEEDRLPKPLPAEAVQPDNFGEFVEEETSPSRTPIQQLQDALVQLRPRQAARIQETPFFQGLLKIATKNPRTGQLVQDLEGNMWNITFDREGNIKKQVKLNLKKAPSSLKNTTKILQAQNEDGSIGMEAVTFDSTGKLSRREPLPGIIPKSFKIDLGTTKPTKTKIEQELISISTDLNELGRLRDSLFTTKGRPKELLTPLGRTKAFFFELADRAGALDPDLPLGAVIKNIEEITGTKAQKETVARVREFRRVENQVGKIFTKFRKEITGVAGPPEEFERLEAISLSIRKLGPIGLDAAIQVLEDSKRDQQELLKNVFLANNKEEFLRALGGRMDSRIEGLKIKFQDNPAVLNVINEADLAKIKEQELRRDIVGEDRRFNEENVPQSFIDTLDSFR